MNFAGTVDVSAFEAVAREYAKAGGKTLEFALWRGMWQWGKKALAHYRGVSPSKKALARIDSMFFMGRRGGDRQWRLMSWLAKGKPLGGEHPLAEFAEAERKARRKSVGFTSALIFALSQAARAKAKYISPSGIRGSIRRIKGGIGSAVEVDAQSVYYYKTGLTRARKIQDPTNVERNALAAFAATEAAQVADMENYIAKKLAEKAPK